MISEKSSNAQAVASNLYKITLESNLYRYKLHYHPEIPENKPEIVPKIWSSQAFQTFLSENDVMLLRKKKILVSRKILDCASKLTECQVDGVTYSVLAKDSEFILLKESQEINSFLSAWLQNCICPHFNLAKEGANIFFNPFEERETSDRSLKLNYGFKVSALRFDGNNFLSINSTILKTQVLNCNELIRKAREVLSHVEEEQLRALFVGKRIKTIYEKKKKTESNLFYYLVKKTNKRIY